MYGGLGMSAPSLHRESTDSLMIFTLVLLFTMFLQFTMHMYSTFIYHSDIIMTSSVHNNMCLSKSCNRICNQ